MLHCVLARIPLDFYRMAYRLVKRFLIIAHLYAGFALCMLFVVWFVSGIFMAYYRAPTVNEAGRLDFAPTLSAQSAASSLPPARVGALASRWQQVEILRLGEISGRPIYRWRARDTGWHSAWADTGDAAEFDTATLTAEARLWLGTAYEPQYRGTYREHSQWTFFQAARPHYPLHRFSTGGLGAREVYLSSRTGEPVVATTPGSRLMYYLGPGLHYFSLYFVRNNDSLWRNLVNWSSGVAAATCLVGIVLGLWQMRWRAFRQGSKVIPYTKPWMRWHHLFGLWFGLLAFTFVLSGLFSMNPGRIFPSAQVPSPLARAYMGPMPAADAVPSPVEVAQAAGAQAAVREYEWQRVRGNAVALVVATPDQRTLITHGAGGWQFSLPFTASELVRHLEGLEIAGIVRSEWLTAFDNYYYARKDRWLPLPVLRLRLDDSDGTWLYLDPATGRLFMLSNEGTRLRRWLYNGLHSFDLQLLLSRGLTWDVAIWSASLAGLALSVTSAVISWQWLRRRRSRTAWRAPRTTRSAH